jgi:quinol monooxygenase YgiN
MVMAITVVWDTWLKPGAEAEGLRLTRQVWSDMRAFEGYVSHQLLVDQDAPGHVIALGRWRSRADADRVGSGTRTPRRSGCSPPSSPVRGTDG